jgi:Fe/S biogenesis protein NfuA
MRSALTPGADGATLKVIVPAKDLDALTGATLDHTSTQGLIIRNRTARAPPNVEGLTNDDDLCADVEASWRRERSNGARRARSGFVTYVGHDGADGTAFLTMAAAATDAR